MNGTTYVATSVTSKRTGSTIEIDATMNDGQYDQTMTITYQTTDSGSDTCGSSIFGGSRAITYSETFDDGGQTATEAQYMSGLDTGGTDDCTCDVTSASPASGSASGALDDSNSLIGGGTVVKDPVTFTVSWSDVP